MPRNRQTHSQGAFARGSSCYFKYRSKAETKKIIFNINNTGVNTTIEADEYSTNQIFHRMMVQNSEMTLQVRYYQYQLIVSQEGEVLAS